MSAWISHPYLVEGPLDVADEWKEWLKTNCVASYLVGKWVMNSIRVGSLASASTPPRPQKPLSLNVEFEDRRDAMLFKLTWGGL